jgi:hypothetical protein
LSLKKINLSLFGEEHPSFLRIVMTFLIFVIMGFAIYGYMADFIPSASWSTTSLYLSICITVAAISAHYYLLAIGYTSLNGEKSKALNVLSLLLFPFLAFAFVWTAITHGMADVLTQKFGSDQQMVLELTKHKHEVSRKETCIYRLVGSAIDNSFPEHLCVTQAEFEALPKSGSISLQGQQSSLGFHVEGVDLQSTSVLVEAVN